MISLNFSKFCNEFRDMNRQNQFSYEAKRELFNYIKENYPDNYELDVTELCCDWNEEELDTVLKDYGLDTIEELMKRTTVIELDNGMILFLVY